jgi:uncharacterized repeat protein (TIGR03803 family)
VYGLGTVFALKGAAERILYSFKGGDDGSAPVTSLAFVDGRLYGTTPHGGGQSCHYEGCGTVFSVTLAGKEAVIHHFQGSSYGGKDGATPLAGLVVANGRLFGTTAYGGESCSDYGCGTAFGMTTQGAEIAIYRFQGEYPDARGTLLFSGNKLYGTLVNGGRFQQGAVFSVRP